MNTRMPVREVQEKGAWPINLCYPSMFCFKEFTVGGGEEIRDGEEKGYLRKSCNRLEALGKMVREMESEWVCWEEGGRCKASSQDARREWGGERREGGMFPNVRRILQRKVGKKKRKGRYGLKKKRSRPILTKYAHSYHGGFQPLTLARDACKKRGLRGDGKRWRGTVLRRRGTLGRMDSEYGQKSTSCQGAKENATEGGYKGGTS